MVIYVDLVFIFNFLIDFSLLLLVSMVLKRKIKIIRIFLGSLVGSITSFFIFFTVSNFVLFIVKLVVSILMVLTCFSYYNRKYFMTNLIYLYFLSIILGGILYFLDIQFGFLNVWMILLSPLFLFIYVKKVRRVNKSASYYYNVDVYYKGNKYCFNAFLDTGNKLYDQYKKRPIILVYNPKIEYDYQRGILVPYKTASGEGIMKCIYADKVIINDNKEVLNVLIGLCSCDFNIAGVNMILHMDIL